MSETLFPRQRAISVSEPASASAPLEPGYETPQQLTDAESEEVRYALFNKPGYQRVTWSRHYRREYDIRDKLLKEEFIPKLSDATIEAALRKLRSTIFPLVENQPPALIELGNDPETWGSVTDQIWYNILLGPFIYGKARSNARYDTREDQFDAYDAEDDVPAETVVEPAVEQAGNAEMLYWENVIMCGHDIGGGNEKFFIITHQEPTESNKVDYLRRQRKLFDTENDAFLLVLYHNLLVPYVFGKR